MGPIVDRSREYLGAADVVISLARRLLLQAVRRHQDEGVVPFVTGATDFAKVRSISVTYPQSENWRAIDPFAPPRLDWTVQPVV
jgi:hypothetical protein